MDDKRCWPCDEVITEKLPGCPLQCKSPNCPSYKKPPPPDLKDKLMIWVIGAPGAGKRTQCNLIVGKYGFTNIYVGDLLREEIKKGTVRSKCFISLIERDELVPNDHVIELIKEKMYATAAKTKCYLVNGCPREERQGLCFEKNIAPVSLVLYLEASDEVLTKRLLDRAKKMARKDDNPDSVKIRLKNFHKHNRLIVEQYPHRLVKVNAEKTENETFQDCCKAIDEVLVQHEARLEAKERDKAKAALPTGPTTPSAFEQSSKT